MQQPPKSYFKTPSIYFYSQLIVFLLQNLGIFFLILPCSFKLKIILSSLQILTDVCLAQLSSFFFKFNYFTNLGQQFLSHLVFGLTSSFFHSQNASFVSGCHIIPEHNRDTLCIPFKNVSPFFSW